MTSRLMRMGACRNAKSAVLPRHTDDISFMLQWRSLPAALTVHSSSGQLEVLPCSCCNMLFCTCPTGCCCPALTIGGWHDLSAVGALSLVL